MEHLSHSLVNDHPSIAISASSRLAIDPFIYIDPSSYHHMSLVSKATSARQLYQHVHGRVHGKKTRVSLSLSLSSLVCLSSLLYIMSSRCLFHIQFAKHCMLRKRAPLLSTFNAFLPLLFRMTSTENQIEISVESV